MLLPANEVAKVMFLHVSVILSTGWGSAPVHAGMHTPPGPEADTPPQVRGRHPPKDQRQTPREQCMLGDTGNKRAVRILLECILVAFLVFFIFQNCSSETTESLHLKLVLERLRNMHCLS